MPFFLSLSFILSFSRVFLSFDPLYCGVVWVSSTPISLGELSGGMANPISTIDRLNLPSYRVGQDIKRQGARSNARQFAAMRSVGDAREIRDVRTGACTIPVWANGSTSGGIGWTRGDIFPLSLLRHRYTLSYVF